MRLLFYLLGAVLFFAGASLAVTIYVGQETAPYIEALETLPLTETALVLGASVTSTGILSPVLRERADRAAELYREGKVGKILVTGDNATVSHNEVNPVGNYLIAAGIPKSDIFLDHAGFDTYSSMYRAREVFNVHSMAIVTQAFHLPRSVYVARRLGIEAYGVPAGEGGNFLYNSAREVPATLKALSDLAFARLPKYLGEQYPITGDGSPTWYEATSTDSTSSPQAATTSVPSQR